VILGHVITLDPTVEQDIYLRRACGVARAAYNWGLAEWKRAYAGGEKPSAAKIKAKWNAVRKTEFPWSYAVTKCASGQAIRDLGTAFTNFFRDCKKPKAQRRARFPRFKSKRSDNNFALWNDQFEIDGERIRIPVLGWVRMQEALRFEGKIMGARVARLGTHWHVSVQVEVGAPERVGASQGTVGVDLGIAALMTLSRPLPDGRTKIANPQARRSRTRGARSGTKTGRAARSRIALRASGSSASWRGASIARNGSGARPVPRPAVVSGAGANACARCIAASSTCARMRSTRRRVRLRRRSKPSLWKTSTYPAWPRTTASPALGL